MCIYSESCVSGVLPRLLAKNPCRFTRSIALYREVIKEVDYSQQPSLISKPLGERWLKHADYKFSGEAYSKTQSINFSAPTKTLRVCACKLWSRRVVYLSALISQVNTVSLRWVYWLFTLARWGRRLDAKKKNSRLVTESDPSFPTDAAACVIPRPNKLNSQFIWESPKYLLSLCTWEDIKSKSTWDYCQMSVLPFFSGIN